MAAAAVPGATRVALRSLGERLPDEPSPFEQLWGLTGREFVLGYINLQDPDVAKLALPFVDYFDPP